MRRLIVLAMCVGCGADDPCLENKSSIESGVYGLVRGEAAVFVSAFATNTDATPSSDDLIASTTTDGDCYYELELPAQGGYKLCRAYGNSANSTELCVTVVTASPPVRWDVVQGGDLVGDKWHQFACLE